MGALLLISGFAVLSWWLSRTARRVPRRSRFGPVLLADREADGCVLCELDPCEAGPHMSATYVVGLGVDHGDDQ